MGKKIFGEAGNKVIIEECLMGKEVSLLAFSDGKNVIPLPPACDYKRVFDGDRGPNTGGMGCYSSPGFFDDKMVGQVMDTIVKPTIRAMNDEKTPYEGVLYTGLMITDTGPKVLEYNARFGDPETQAILPRLKTDLLDIMLAVINKNLGEIDVDWNKEACVGVVMASTGYPGSYQIGFPIKGLNNLDKGIIVFHAGTKINDRGEMVTDGGRVLTVTTTGEDMSKAREKIYRNLKKIAFEGCHYRKDIAEREVN